MPGNRGDKRERGKNFTEFEKEKLIEICLKYKDVMENKKTDTFSVQKKNAIWEKICKEYNDSQITGVRDPKNLRILYDNMKIKVRKERQDEKAEKSDGETSSENVRNKPAVITLEKAADHFVSRVSKRKISNILKAASDASDSIKAITDLKIKLLNEEHEKKMELLDMEQELFMLKMKNEMKREMILDRQLLDG